MTTAPSPARLPATTKLGTVTLLAHDLQRLGQFYTELLGLQVLNQTPASLTLGLQGQPLLTLQAAPTLPAPATSRPGLYHTAFLQPSRAELGRWLAHALPLGLQIGSGDHRVSEAFYLSDPEGNGIEVYADRPRDTWTWENGQVRMDTQSGVDAASVLAEAAQPSSEPYHAPAGLSVGHIHLKVGDVAQAAQFYSTLLGMDIVAQIPGAAFLSWGGYHHQLGLNEWHSRGQARPQQAATGLSHFEFVASDLSGLRGQAGLNDQGDQLSFTDPWGNAVTVRQQR